MQYLRLQESVTIVTILQACTMLQGVQETTALDLTGEGAKAFKVPLQKGCAIEE